LKVGLECRSFLHISNGPHIYVHLFSCSFFNQIRKPLIPDDVKPRLWSYMGGIARENGSRALAIGGMSEHAHLLLSLKPVMPIATAVKIVKAGSSGWMSDLLHEDFKWQEGTRRLRSACRSWTR
jgi:REP element-mobilizing transposase RayT